MTVLYDIHSGIISLTKRLSLLTGNELHAPSLRSSVHYHIVTVQLSGIELLH